jgi:hypothetical protein
MGKEIDAIPKTPHDPQKEDGSAFAARARDLSALREAAIDAAGVGGGLWFSYLFSLFYLAIAIGGITHKDLLLENPVKANEGSRSPISSRGQLTDFRNYLLSDREKSSALSFTVNADAPAQPGPLSAKASFFPVSPSKYLLPGLR